MYLRRLDIENLRSLEHVAFEPNVPGESKLTYSNVTLVLGNNGLGKTSVLRAVALAVLSPVIASSSGYVPYSLVRRAGPDRRTASIRAQVTLHREHHEGAVEVPDGSDRVAHRTSCAPHPRVANNVVFRALDRLRAAVRVHVREERGRHSARSRYRDHRIVERFDRPPHPNHWSECRAGIRPAAAPPCSVAPATGALGVDGERELRAAGIARDKRVFGRTLGRGASRNVGGVPRTRER
nr:AAA family ATPase [Deltaproteobacteria bacterium]